MFIFVVLLASLAAAVPITSLPNYIGPALSMDSGYVTVNAAGGRAQFYWLIRSTGKPSTDPVVFWFQGGPGCSSLYGLFLEHGPLQPQADGSIRSRNLAWTNFANMVYVEAPAGVGFSYSNNSNFSPSDTSSADDNFAFISGFFRQFPEYQQREYWVTGESYGGMYVPTVVEKLLSSGSSSALYKNLRGFMVGNPVFGCSLSTDTNSLVEPFYWHGAVSYKDYAAWYANSCDQNESSSACQTLLADISNGVGNSVQEAATTLERRLSSRSPLPSWDPDNLYQNFVTDNGTLEIVNSQVPSGGYEPVLTDYLQAYLSRPSVQAAVHVAPFLGTVQWSPCANINYNANTGSLIPFYKKIHALKPNLRILVYSGDVDIGTVPFFNTDRCLAELSATRTRPWGPWFVNSATAGYWESYDWYTRAFIKGSGHEAPYYQPVAALSLFKRFLQSGSLVDPNGNNRPAPARRNVLTQGSILRDLMAKKRREAEAAKRAQQ